MAVAFVISLFLIAERTVESKAQVAEGQVRAG
jgi:hypothetical protein